VIRPPIPSPVCPGFIRCERMRNADRESTD
jgi:hypothetical protein